MEIEKGICDFCSADRVLCEIKRRKFQKLFESLFKQHINADLLEDAFESFKVCPLCHEKFILLDTQYKAIKSHKKGRNSDNCILCGDEDELYKIKNWPHFDRLSEDFDFESKTVLICPACLVYMDHRNTIKQQLLQQNHKSNHSTKRTPRERQNHESFEKHQNSPPNLKKGIKTLEQQKKILPKTLISDYKLYNSILYVRLDNCDFSSKDNDSSFGKSEDRLQDSEKTQLGSSKHKRSSNKNVLEENSESQTDSSSKNMEFQIVSCSNTRKSAFKIKFKSLQNRTKSPPLSKQSKLQSVSTIKKRSTFELSPKTIKQLLKEHHMLKELSVQILREDLKKKQQFGLYNRNTIIICDSDDNDLNDLVKDVINKISDESDPLDIPELHIDVHREKESERKRTKKSNVPTRRSKFNKNESTEDSTDEEVADAFKTKRAKKAKIASKGKKNNRDEQSGDEYIKKGNNIDGEAAKPRAKRTRKQKTPSKRAKLDSDEGSDSEENNSKATSKRKSKELKNRKARDSNESDSEKDDSENNSKAKDREAAEKLKKQANKDKNESEGEENQNNSKSEDTVGENEEESKSDTGSDKETVKRRKSKPRRLTTYTEPDESNINETEGKPEENEDEPKNRPESDLGESDKVEMEQKESEENLQSKKEKPEDQTNSKEDKIGGETDDIGEDQTDDVGEEQSNTGDQTECNTKNNENIAESMDDNEQSTLEENKQNDPSPKEDSIEGDSSEAVEVSADKEETQVEESEQNKQEKGEHDSEEKENDPDKDVTEEIEAENDMISGQDNEVGQNDEISTLLEDTDSNLGQNKETEEQNKPENEDSVLEETENAVTSVDAPSCEDEANNENRECDNIDSEGGELEDVEGKGEKYDEDDKENTKKRKSDYEIFNEPKKPKVDDGAKTPVEDDGEVEKELDKMSSQPLPKRHPVLFGLSDTEDNDSETTTENKIEDNTDENIEHDGKQDFDSSNEKGMGNNGHIDDENETLNYEYSVEGEETLGECVDEEKCDDVSNSSICSNGTEKKKKKVTFNEESNVTFE